MFNSFFKKIFNKKIIFYLILIFLGTLFFLIRLKHQPPCLIVDFLDIGQGDSSLIITPDKKIILIDGGPDNTILHHLGEILPFYRRRIDLVIFSHFHEDHITGLIEILKRYQVKKVIYAQPNFSSPILESLLKMIKTRKIPVFLVKSQAQLDFFPDCSLFFLNVDSLGLKSAQNNSLLVKLDCYQKRFLFTGDNSSTVERALLKADYDLKSEVLKDPHHGSRTANSEKFLEAVDPQLVSISVGSNNRFKLPSPVILERLKDLNIKYWRTDLEGSLKIVVFKDSY